MLNLQFGDQSHDGTASIKPKRKMKQKTPIDVGGDSIKIDQE